MLLKQFLMGTAGSRAADLGSRPPSVRRGNNSISTDKGSWLWRRSAHNVNSIRWFDSNIRGQPALGPNPPPSVCITQ
ncbi:hypothetical protein NQZ68_005002 [Dissostichus eleginoides]|nr:hypothetical protein NQZ68_005002 [Dissostichus eleginoides]